MTDTDRIDLDELADEEEGDDEPAASRGDWFWSGEGDPDEEPESRDLSPAESGVSRRIADETDGDAGAGAPDGADDDDSEVDGDADGGSDATDDGDADGDGGTGEGSSADDRAIPRVPRETDGSPVGVPSDAGGAGAGPAEPGGGVTVGSDADSAGGDPDAGGEADDRPETAQPTNEVRQAAEAAGAEPMSGPHGGGVDDMTMAITYDAARRLSDPQLTIAKARDWADWIGIVGEVEAPVINRFQRENRIDADFFNGTGTGPAERLANIGPSSMFHAKRTVVVGTPDDEWIADAADWEFIPFEEAADAADWGIGDADEAEGEGDAGEADGDADAGEADGGDSE